MSDTMVRSAIAEALARYCRGVDRLDAESLASAFHPGATLHGYGPTPMTVDAFVEQVLPLLGATYTATQHRISNTLVEFVDGTPASGAALVETYVQADHVRATDAGEELHTFSGRYIDRFTDVDGRWLIAERVLRSDWSRIAPIDRRMRGAFVASGRGDRSDPLYASDPATSLTEGR